jgi:hypothetical protein
MSRPLPWVRLDRDFDQDPAIQAMAERQPPSLVLAAYCLTLAGAARSDGVFTSSDALERTIRMATRCKPSQATAIVADLIATGILDIDGVALRLAKWSDLQPKERHLTKSQRVASGVATSVASGVEPTQHHERTDEHHEPTDAATTRLVDGVEVVFAPLLEKPEPRTICSHGERFEERTGSPDGRRFWSAGHRVDGGAWCGEKP